MPTVSNVSTAKPKAAGAVYLAASGTSLPDDASTALGTAFTQIGYVSEDGLTNTNSIDSDIVKAWGGDVVNVLETGKEDTFQFSLIEALNTDVLKAVYGAGNVSGNLTSGITVKANSAEHEACVWVFDMIMRDGAVKRIVIPSGVITETGDVQYKDDELVAYEVTVTCLADDSGNTHYEYILKA